IGFAKDHYDGDETAFNWYAKGTPFCMDYGTYGDAGGENCHNLVEIPDRDPLRRGYLADHLFTPAIDYTRCECPVTLKLLHGRMRSFAEVEDAFDRNQTTFFYIGDKNPVGPKAWKVRQLMFVKPDYVVLFDRVYGEVPHRYNLHFTGTLSPDGIVREGEGTLITGKGRFDLDLLAFIQHPARHCEGEARSNPALTIEFGEKIPSGHHALTAETLRRHGQHFVRLYNTQDGIYRTLLFAKEASRDVRLSSVGATGIKVETPEYTDYAFLANETVKEVHPDVRFTGRAGWIRRLKADGTVSAMMMEGDAIAAFGKAFHGRGPWQSNADGTVTLLGGAPREVLAR
ncbi:MAG: hypothetical protein FWF84_07590, partial [Kiritimatiellaeota bacterium]|nr:hypothetical protein [Kiritimatiellota bacterium]